MEAKLEKKTSRWTPVVEGAGGLVSLAHLGDKTGCRVGENQHRHHFVFLLYRLKACVCLTSRSGPATDGAAADVGCMSESGAARIPGKREA